MLVLKLRDQVFVGVSLMLLMLVTRGHHFASLFHLPDASLAVFFLAGVYLRARWKFLLLSAMAGVIDWIAISWGGVSSFCVTPAYAMLLPAYASLWLGGRWYAKHYHETATSLMWLIVIAVTSALMAELFASGGFYFFGGRFAEPTLFGFVQRLLAYFPHILSSLALYLGIAASLHSLVVCRRQARGNFDAERRA